MVMIVTNCPLDIRIVIKQHLEKKRETINYSMKFQYQNNRKFNIHQTSNSTKRRSPSTSSLIGFFLYLVVSQRHTIAILCFLAVSVTILFHVDWIKSRSNESSSLGEDLVSLQQARISKATATDIPMTTTTTTTNSHNIDNNYIRHQHHQAKRQEQQGQLPESSFDLSNLPSCSAVRLSLNDDDDDATLQQQFKLDRPTIFTDWGGRDSSNVNAGAATGAGSPIEGTWDFINFQQTYGKYYNYVKGDDVQPLVWSSNKQANNNGQQKQQRCITTTKTLMNTMINNNDKHGSKIDLLFFTNNIENPKFLKALKRDYIIPSIIQNITTFQKGFDVFSAMSHKSSHPFHKHDVAWLGQVVGTRVWFLLPPTIPRSKIGTKINACEYVNDISKLPLHNTNLVQACVQQAGEIMYLPANWWHATCSLQLQQQLLLEEEEEEKSNTNNNNDNNWWSVGIGGQGGTPKNFQQDFNIPTDLLRYGIATTTTSTTTANANANANANALVGDEDVVEREKIDECLAMAAILRKEKQSNKSK